MSMPRAAKSFEPTVFLVDDDEAVRAALIRLLRSEGLATEAFDSAGAFLSHFDPARPGCLLLDVRMPGLDGLDLQHELLARGADIPIVFITGHGDVPMAVRALKDGAFDFIEKPIDPRKLPATVKAALARDAHQRDMRHQRESTADRLRRLTRRECEVMREVVKGLANKQIAHELDISVKTVEVHRAHVMQKLRVTSVAELVALALSSREDSAPN